MLFSQKGRVTFGLCALFFVLSAAAQTPEQAAMYERAKQLMTASKFDEAIPVWRDLVRSAPGQPGLMLNFGLSLHLSGHDVEAVEEFGKLLRIQPNAYPALVMSAVSEMRLGHTSRAIPLFERALIQKPDDLEARRMLADAQLLLGRHESALANLRKITAATPQDPKAWYGLGRTCELMATKTYEDLVKIAPTSSYALLLAAEARLRQKKYISAFGLFKEAESKRPVLPGLHLGLADVYEKTGHPDWAAAERAKEKPVPPSPPSAAAVKATRTPEALFWQTRRYNDQALAAFRKLASLPPSAQLYEVVAELQRNQGQFTESLQSWQEALKLKPGDRGIQREIATTVYLSHDYAKAEPLARQELAREPNSAELNYMLGDILLNQQKPAEAVPFLEKAVRSGPGILAAQSALARSYGQTGQAAKAIPHLEAALPVDLDGALHYQLARAYQAAGRTEEARRLLARSQELQKGAESTTEEGVITAPAP